MSNLLGWLKSRVWVVVLGLSISDVSPQIYTVTDLGLLTDIGSQSQSKPNAINKLGNVAAVNVVGGAYRALVYTGAWTNLGTLGGGNSYAAGLNNSGRVVGYSLTTAGLDHAFLWTPGGTDGVFGNIQMKDLGTLGGSSSEAYAINQNGEITGFAQTSKNDHAFTFSGGVMTDIGGLLGNALPNSYGYAINDSGHIAGSAYNNSYSTAHAFLYNGATAQDIGTLGGSDANASAINNNDQVAGYAGTSGGFDHAFRYSGGLMTDLGTLGGNYSYANGINNSNVIVGGAFIDSADSIFHAFICASNSMTDLNTSLDGSGTGWTLVEARAINDAGHIVGVGTFAGNNHGFLLGPVSQTIQQQPTNSTVACQGSATFVVKAVPTAVSYQWCRGNPPSGVAIPNATNSVLSLANVTGAQAGAYYVVVSTALGSETSAVATLTVLDSSPPVLSGCPLNIIKVADAGGCTAVVTWTNPVAIDACDGLVPVTCTPTNGSRFNRGVTTVICSANDSSRNTNTCAFTVTIVDSSPPTFSGCPVNQTNYALNGASTATATWITPSAVDACGGVVPVICTPQSGSMFDQGVTTVTCSANDSSGNSNSCTFTITVVKGQDLQVTDLKLVGNDVVISFTSVDAGQYSMQAIGYPAGNWTDVLTGIPGKNGIVTVTNLGGVTFPQRFFRIRQTLP